MKTSPETNEISAALAKAQGEMKNPEKTRTADYPTKTGGRVKFNYADLAACYDVAREALSKNGIAHVVTTGYVETNYTLFCRLTHTSGQWYEAEWPLPNDEPKVVGAHITYGTRYLFTAMAGLSPDEDMDAEPQEGGKYEQRAVPAGAIPPRIPMPGADHPTAAQIKRMFTLVSIHKIPEELFRHYMTTEFKVESSKDLTRPQYDLLCAAIEKGLIV